ncbi:hypothetical protein UVI_02003640 [Ustilaginoidea virens]|uniref:Metalloprotease m41 ftsh n=1 Tax=Ustilaginoidea virens TaxID=1159556 RepID=A0A1B5L114_USTVR|nr:hypothetical protein UVI_02003640 [Ustilaginoidea virens]
MDTDTELQRLRASFAQIEQQNEQLKQENKRLGQQNERLEQQNDRLEQQNDRLEQTQQNTTLSQYLKNCHRLLFQSLAVRPADSGTGTTVTKVDGKFYPRSLRPWTAYRALKEEFEFIKDVLKEDRLFSAIISIKDLQRRVCGTPVATEDDVKPFEYFAIEGPVMDIIRELCTRVDSNPAIASLNASGITFTNHSLGVNPPADEILQGDLPEGTEKQRRDQSPRKRVAVEPKKIIPDRRCLREDPAGNREISFVIEYKAAHLLQPSRVRRGLTKHLFTNVIKARASTKSSTDEAQSSKDRSDRILAMALTQTYDYMIRLGLKYSYLAAGKLFVFLLVEEDDPTTLHYHMVDPAGEAEDDEGVLTEFRTAVAQVACFTLLALRTKTRPSSWTAEAQEVLAEWPIPYADMEHETTDEEEFLPNSSSSSDLSFDGDALKVSPKKFVLRSRGACKNPDAVHGRREGADDDDDSNDTLGHSSRRCLLGLKRGQQLDANCPNVASHRMATTSTKHPIHFEDLATLLQEQLAHSLWIHCEPLEKTGKYGAVGTLFKLTLARYGYTFVGKGTIQGFVPYLRHAAKVFDRLERIQGEVVPVYLGSITLAKPYPLTAQNAIRFAGTNIVHMLLMSWGGEAATSMGERIDLSGEVMRSLNIVRSEGVDHDDPRNANWLWNEERNCVVVIDFDTAHLLPPPKPRLLRKLVGRKRKSMRGQGSSQARKRMSLSTSS